MNQSLLLDNVDISKAQLLAIFGSFALLFFLLHQIRSKRIKEEYSLLWLFISVIFIIFSVWRDGLNLLARAVGVAYAPAALFLVLILAIFLILIQFSIIISKTTENNKHLTQEHSILKLEVKKLKHELAKIKSEMNDGSTIKSEHTDKLAK
ncbi:MAG: DUF2304 domain-containing protein [Bacteroidales bacterium]|nr:DUF2304 domain-containing protein [Bacteroidales bacterium]